MIVASDLRIGDVLAGVAVTGLHVYDAHGHTRIKITLEGGVVLDRPASMSLFDVSRPGGVSSSLLPGRDPCTCETFGRCSTCRS